MSDQTCRCGKPTAGAVLCDDCQTTFRYAIVHVGVYLDDLGTVARKQARYGSAGATKGSIGKAQPLPVDLRFVSGNPINDKRTSPATLAPGSQLRWDGWNTVVAWCRTVMEEQPELHGPICEGDCLHVSCAAIRRRRWPRNTVASMVRYLSRQFRWLAREDWSPVMLSEFLDLERRLTRFVDRPADKWYAGRCGVTVSSEEGEETYCPAELYASEDRAVIDCPACDIRHDVAERREVLLKEAKHVLVTATEAASALIAWTDYGGSADKLVDRIRKWRGSGRLEDCGNVTVGGKERSLYRLGDVQGLLIEAAQAEQERIVRAAKRRERQKGAA